MERKSGNAVLDIMRKIYKKRPWNSFVTVIAGTIVFITTYMLILPAITMTPDPVCGLEEHTHTDACYAPQTYEAVLDCSFANAEAIVIHTHDANCYDSEGRLVCTLPEREAHVHTAECFSEGVRTDLEVQDFDFVSDELAAFGAGEENGGIADYEGTGSESAPADYIGEGSGNALTDYKGTESGHAFADAFGDGGQEVNAFISGGSAAAGMASYEEESLFGDGLTGNGSTGETAPICGKEELVLHTHGEGCYDADGILICSQPEVIAHQHTVECFKTVPVERALICGLEEHVHTDDCYKEQAEDAGLFVIETGESIAEDTTATGEETGAAGAEENDDAGAAAGQTVIEENETGTAGLFVIEEDTADAVAEETTSYRTEEGPENLPEGEKQNQAAPGSGISFIIQPRETEIFTEVTTEMKMEASSEIRTERQQEVSVEVETRNQIEVPAEVMTESRQEASTEIATGSQIEAPTEVTTENRQEVSTEIATRNQTEVSSEATTESQTEASSEIITRSQTEASSEITTRSQTEASSEFTTSQTEAFAETVTETQREAATDFTTENQLEATSERTTEWYAEESTETTTAWIVEATTEATTQWYTEESTELTTQASAETTTATLEFRGADYKVILTYTKASGLPEGASVVAEEIAHDSDLYNEYLAQAKAALGLSEDAVLPAAHARFFDIQILDQDGIEREPSGPVKVEIIYDKPVEVAASQSASANVLHFDEEKNAEVLATVSEGESETENGNEIDGSNQTGDTEEINQEEVNESTVGKEENESSGAGWMTGDESTPPANQDDAESDGTEEEQASAADTADNADMHYGDEGTVGTTEVTSFFAESFSVYGIVYTVDFHWEVDGKTYDFGIPGGGFAALSDVLQALVIEAEEVNAQSEEDETEQEPAHILTENAGTGIEDTVVREFLEGVEKVEFSDPSLVWVGKIDAAETVGNLKEANELEVQYSDALTEEQIEEINTQTVQAGDWALISLLPFDTEESLTVIMKNGEQFVIRVTDARTRSASDDVAGKHGVTNTENVKVYSGHNLVFNTQIDTIETEGTRVTLLGTESGGLNLSSWYWITYMKDGEAVTGYVETEYIDILEMVEPVNSENDAFAVTASWEERVLPEGTELGSGEPLLTEEERKDLENQAKSALSVLTAGTDKALKVTGIYFFDLSFMSEDEEVEPNGEVKVSMQLKQAIATEEKEGLHLVHFTGGTAELLEDTKFTKDESGNITGLDFTVGSFSTFAVVKTIETTFIDHNGEVYEVTVYYTDDANIPDGSTLRVREFSEDSDEYNYARRAVLADKKEKNEWVNLSSFGFAALDISILNSQGVEIEPDAMVYVDLKIKSLPGVEDLEKVKDTLAIQHHVETYNGVVVERVYSGTDNASFKVETKNVIISNGVVVDPDSISDEDFDNPIEQYVETEFPTEFFSTYSVTWNNGGNRATVHYGYMESGTFKEFPVGTPSYTPDFTANYNYLIYDVDGYKYSSTRLSTPSGTEIQPMLQEGYYDRWGGYHSGYYYYGNNGKLQSISNNQNIYVIYDKESSPAPGGTPEVPEEMTWPDQDTPASKPEFSKSSINNGDDTNTITLSVKAPEKDVANYPKANVIVVLDLSASMSDPIDNQDNQTRLQREKKAVSDMAETLLSKKGVDGSSLVKMSLITFGAEVVVEQSFTDNKTTFKNKVNGLSAYSESTYKGGTNWEGALYEANRLANADEDAATFVVFVTDGDPTFRVSRGEWTDQDLLTEQTLTDARFKAYREHQLFGYGTTTDGYNGDRYEQNFNSAVEQVSQIVEQNKYFYTIGISNDVTKADKLCTDAGLPEGHAFLASNSGDLTNAFNSVVESISATLGFGDLKIEDGITALTNLKMKVLQSADTGSIKYYRYGGENDKYGADEEHKTEWTTRETDGCGAATYNPDTGSMEWNMGESFQLEDDVTYLISFRVWPSQAAYDLIADLNNGTKTWDDLESGEKDQIVVTGTDSQTGKKTYALKTNTDTVTATYKHTILTGNVVTIGSETEYPADYNEGTIENMNLKSDQIKVRKEWEHGINESHSATSVNFRLLMDGKYYQENGGADTQENTAQIIQVNDTTTPKWENSIFIATGIMDYDETTGAMDILESGHDYVLDEYQLYEGSSLSEYAESYEFKSQTVHPMRINGTLTYLILYENDSEVPAGSKTYVLNGKKYYTATGSTGILSGTNYRKAELDITKLIENHSALTESDLDSETFTYRVTLQVPKDADVSLITVYEFVKRSDAPLYYIDGYKAGETPVTGDEERFSEKAYRWYTVSYGTRTVDGNSVGVPVGEGFVNSGDGEHKTITMDVTLNRNEVLRFTNLPTGTNYIIQEIYANYRQASPSRDVDATGSSASSNLEAQGYSITKIVSKSTGGTESVISGTSSITGTISEPNKRYYNQFTNTLGNVADADISVTKHLENYSWSGEKYYFKLTANDSGNPMPMRDTLYLSSSSGTEDKTYSFGKIRFTQAGTYTYTITETDAAGNSLSGTASENGIIYGGAETVTITVGSANGKLAVTSIVNSKGEVISEGVEGSAVIKGSAVITNSLNEVPIKKIDSESKNVINGAVFELYQGINKLYFDKNSRVLTPEQVQAIIGMSVSEDGSDKKMEEAEIVSSFTIGETRLRGLLLNTDYVLKEKKAPDGYVITSNDFEFKLVKNTGTERISLSLKEGQENISLDSDGITILVDNTPGAALPNTGGLGTNMFYLFGIMLTGLAGAGFMMSRRRRSAA